MMMYYIIFKRERETTCGIGSQNGIRQTDRQTDGTFFSFLQPVLIVYVFTILCSAHYRPSDKRWKLAVFPSEWLFFFPLWTKQQHQQQRGVHMWCVPVVAAAAAFSLCIINCRTPVVIDTCMRHGSNRRGERWEATREEEKKWCPSCVYSCAALLLWFMDLKLCAYIRYIFVLFCIYIK